MTSSGGVVRSPATLIAGMELPVPVLAASPSARFGSSAEALVGDLSLGSVGSLVEVLARDPSLGGVADGGGMLGVALNGSSPTNLARLAVKIHVPTLASRKWVVCSRWGLSRGLRRGLESGLIMMVSSAAKVPARGTSPVEILALFPILCANVSVSLQ